MGYIGQQITTVFPTSISVDSATVGDDLTVDTSTLKVDSSNNRVGIGTASPEENLEVSHATAPAIQLNRTNDGGFKSILRQQGNDFEIRGSSGSTKIYTGNADGDSSTSRLIIDANGHVTMPSQTCFHATKDGTDETNLGINSNHTMAWASERFDVNTDFDTSANQFVAPVTGKYFLSATARFEQVDTAATYYLWSIVTSNQTYHSILDPNFSADTYLGPTLSLHIVADMDASDTAKVQLHQAGGTNQTDVDGDPQFTFFSGYLVC